MILVTTFARVLTESLLFTNRAVRGISEYEAMTELCHAAQPGGPESVTLIGLRPDDLIREADTVFTEVEGFSPHLVGYSKIYLKPEEGPWIVLS